MGLKFRRGTTAQQSGSLAFGEPYVNTTLGTLVVGGPSGDIVLSSGGTGSTGNFGAISGSGLDITGNANIAGNLTLGGQLTIGDQTSDTVNVVASLSSSLIPSVNNAFDLGSPTKIWKDLYISTGSIKMMDGAGNEVAVLSSTATGMSFDSDISANGVKVGKGGGDLLGNTVLGNGGLGSNTTGNENTMVGSGAGAFNTTGNGNTAVGASAGYINQTATGNTAVGAQSLIYTTGSANTAVGYGTLKRNTVGQFNIALGYLAGQYATGSSDSNVFIGYSAGPQSDSEVYSQLYIGAGETSLIRGNFTGAELRINGKLEVRDNTILSGSLTTRGHILPATTNTYDLGSPSAFWRDIYVSTGSIKFVGAGNAIVGTLTNVGNGLNLDAGIVANGNSSFGTSSLAITSVTGSLAVDGRIIATSITGAIAATNGVISGSSQLTSSFDDRYVLETETGSLQTSITNLNTFTSSINTTIKSKLDTDGVISGSSQVVLSSTNGFSTYSTSVDSRIATEKGRVDAILLAADADKDTFAEIVTLINSVDTTNDNAFASFYTSSVNRLNNLESTSASVNISVTNLNTTTASLNTSVSNLNTLTASALVRFTNLESKSASVDISVSNLNTYTGSNNTTNTTQNSRLTELENSASAALSTNNTQATSITNLNTTTASLNTSVSNINTTTASLNTSVSNINTTTASLNTSVSNLNTFSASALSRLTTLEGKDISITLTGDVTGTGTITDLSNVSFATTIAANSVALGTDTTGDYVASLVQGTGVTITNNSGESATPTIAIGQAVATSSNVQFNSLGIGMAASATAGRIDATNDIVAYSSSDIRFKENITPIENALDKISKISGNTYDWKAENKIEHGYEGNDVGVIAQEIEAVLPQLVQTRENGFKAVKYDKLVALLIQGIKEQQVQIEELKAKIGL